MSVSMTSQPQIKLWRRIVFAIVAILPILLFTGLFFGAPSLLAPFGILGPSSPDYHPQIHRWHDGIWGVLTTIIFSGSLLALIWGGQKRSLIAQFFLLGILLFALVPLPFPGGFDPMQTIILAAIFLVFLVAYPSKRELFNFSYARSVSFLLLGLSVLAAIALAPDVWRNLSLQLTDKTSEHAKSLHWLLSAFLDILLVIAGLLSSSRRAGWKILAIITGIAYLYLGVAALVIPLHPGSWGYVGGGLALLGGLAYIGLTLFESRRASQNVTVETAAEPASLS